MLLRSIPLFLLLACMGADAGTDQAADTPPVADAQQPRTESFLFSDSLRDIRFLVSTHMHMSQGVQCQVEEINVSEKGSREPYVRIPVEHMRCPCPMPDGQFPAVQLMDFDFDGVRDIRVMRAAADLTNPKFDYWLWDPAQRTFVASRMLDSIQDPMFDYERKMVSSQWYDGANHRGGSTYNYQNGRLVMMSNMEKFREGDHERWVVWGMKDGRLQPVREDIHPLPQH